MPMIPLLLIGLHTAAAVFWLFSSAVLGWGQPASASKPMFRAQMIGAVLVVFAGGGLWSILHPVGFGPREMLLAAGAVLGLAAAGVQGALVGKQVRRMKAGQPFDEGKVIKGQRTAAVLLLGGLAFMIAERAV